MNFNVKDHLPKGLADALFVEEDSSPAQSNPVPRPAIPVQTPSQFSTLVGTPPSALVAADSQLLSELRSRTSFESTPLGKQLQGVLSDLADSGISETQKMKTALKISHIPASNVIDTLTGLQASMAADKDKFDAQMAAATTSEVEGRQQKMASVDSQVSDMESQLNALRTTKSTLTTEIAAKAGQIQKLKDNYKAAFDVRSGEISTQISHYQSILQG